MKVGLLSTVEFEEFAVLINSFKYSTYNGKQRTIFKGYADTSPKDQRVI